MRLGAIGSVAWPLTEFAAVDLKLLLSVVDLRLARVPLLSEMMLPCCTQRLHDILRIVVIGTAHVSLTLGIRFVSCQVLGPRVLPRQVFSSLLSVARRLDIICGNLLSVVRGSGNMRLFRALKRFRT